MPPIEPQQTPVPTPSPTLQPVYTPMPGPLPQPTQPNKHKVWLIIAIAILLLVAAGGAAWWWFVSRTGSSENKETSTTQQNTDTSEVRKVGWVEPLRIPGTYKKYDNSDKVNLVATFSYEDEVNNCWIVTDVAPYGTYSRYGKTPKDVAFDLEKEEGATFTKDEAGPKITVNNINGTQSYEFETLHLEKNLDIPSVDHRKESSIVAYKAFGLYAASIDYGCKTETWSAQKGELENLVKQFTVRTEE